MSVLIVDRGEGTPSGETAALDKVLVPVMKVATEKLPGVKFEQALWSRSIITKGGSGHSVHMSILRRLLLIWTLIFWQGGFMFYGGVVVPVGSRILGSDQEQGWITQSVTNYLNVAGAVCLIAWGWDVFAERVASPGGRRLRWLSWWFLVLALGVLAWLHLRMDDLLDLDGFLILDRRRFRSFHQWYLSVSTAQWVVSIMLSSLTIRSWSEGDAAQSGGATAPPPS
ncbi:hypothetical protein [Singulisphaera acidiphila]|uniref:DUF4149 domain-containing protein n=1 Tax=Singulisphaera acidiphila (strain ATCC BAA-1392 / DSM 18658 / VKM B-2454 / MOB10) TaxID=886293 RepID=L0DGQ7_SINAD|nr:hypothetical protein [Singulisphaera acidiphila]AGA28564.1 hypothetical protein Sinac_4368 [Singulisphaera acidiphila DSM 18658]